MSNSFLKPEVIATTILAQLRRDIVLPNLVWRDAVPDFAGAKNDTVSIRVPAFATDARTRTLRTGGSYTLDDLSETKVDLTLDTDVYKGVAISDEELSLDIRDFGAQVLEPVVYAVARGLESAVADEMTGATYAVDLDLDADPFDSLIDARRALNDAGVPLAGRALAVGSGIESEILKSEHLSVFQQSGSDTALREAIIGRIAGFTAVTVPNLDPDTAVAFHQTAFVQSLRAPAKPDGVPFGTSLSYQGMAMRVIRDYDFDNVQDRLLANVYTGTAAVLDHGVIGDDGKFTPITDEDDTSGDDLLVRAVRITSGS